MLAVAPWGRRQDPWDIRAAHHFPALLFPLPTGSIWSISLSFLFLTVQVNRIQSREPQLSRWEAAQLRPSLPRPESPVKQPPVLSSTERTRLFMAECSLPVKVNNCLFKRMQLWEQTLVPDQLPCLSQMSTAVGFSALRTLLTRPHVQSWCPQNSAEVTVCHCERGAGAKREGI